MMATAEDSMNWLSSQSDPEPLILPVTNLNDSGEGSLRAALEMDAPRIVYPLIHGYVDLVTDIEAAPNLWLAGQTAPGPFVTRNRKVIIDSNSAVQHCEFYAGSRYVHGGLISGSWINEGNGIFSITLDEFYNLQTWAGGIGDVYWGGEEQPRMSPLNTDPTEGTWQFFYHPVQNPIPVLKIAPVGGLLPDDIEYRISKSEMPDCLDTVVGAANIFIDHCNFGFGTDIAMKIQANNVTVQNSLFYKQLAHPLHPKGAHSKHALAKTGSGENQSRDVLFYRNAFIDAEGRCPRFGGTTGVIANNYILGSSVNGIETDFRTAGDGFSHVDIIGNYSPDSDNYNGGHPYILLDHEATGATVYIGSDNYWSGAVQTDPWSLPQKGTAPDATSFRRGSTLGSPANQLPVAEAAILQAAKYWGSGKYAGLELLAAESVRASLIANVGARPWDRSPITLEAVARMEANNGSEIPEVEPDWPALKIGYQVLSQPPDPFGEHGDMTRVEAWLHSIGT